MLFNSFIFIELLLATFAIYYLKIFARFQVQILIISSLVFYAYDEPGFVLLLLFSAMVNAFVSYFVVFGKSQWHRLLVTGGVILNLSCLAFFKYSPLFARLFLNSGHTFGRILISIPLPIGISFFTFEGISLMADVYNKKYFREKGGISRSFGEHSKNTLLFISFFPHLISGPILKARDFLPQIGIKTIRSIPWEYCFKNLVMGYFLKMVVADNLNEFTYWLAYPYFLSMSGVTLITLLYGYSCQIFADFAGYSLIAIGLAGLFGYRFNENFNFPYISTSFREFWKRWHISLSSFLMEYLYFPLGGNRKGKVRTYTNLMITMVLGGLWHGAAVSYMVWGAFHGSALCIERYLFDKFKIKMSKPVVFIKWMLVFSLVTLAWLLFKLPEFNQVIMFMTTLKKNFWQLSHYNLIVYIFLYSLPVVAYHMAYLLKSRSKWQIYQRLDYIFYSGMILLIITNSGSAGAFIYFQF